ncbi:MAG: putative methyltransferase [Prokaryotic dsDNA virus sp.]|nr:MAG: putative methyltransferase [Prokaryotic dsDNA virus sp.]|tara:strand:- start:52946 stop:53512 length:567 start_codon:yes stop_codon:yes gene_type:complete
MNGTELPKYRRDLWRLLDQSPLPARIAEIGVAEGLFSNDINHWPIDIETIYLVDRWQCYPTQKGDGGNPQEWHDKNHLDVVGRMSESISTGRVQILRGDSVEMSKQVEDKSLDLVYIDADHSYEGCLRDIRAWHSKVKPLGFMAFHDFENPAYGVKAAVRDFCRSNRIEHIYKLPEDRLADAGAFFQC